MRQTAGFSKFRPQVYLAKKSTGGKKSPHTRPLRDEERVDASLVYLGSASSRHPSTMARRAPAMVLLAWLAASSAFTPSGRAPQAASPSRHRAQRAPTRQHLFFGSPFQWLIGGDEPTPKMVRRKARPNRRHADGPVGEVRMVEDEEGEVEVPEELRPTTLSNNVLRFPREED